MISGNVGLESKKSKNSKVGRLESDKADVEPKTKKPRKNVIFW